MAQSIHKRIALRLEAMHTPSYVGIFVALKLLLAYLTNMINISATDEPITKGIFEFRDNYEAIIVIVVVAPLLETYLIQYLFFKYLTGRLPQWSIIVLSALVFGLMHHYSIGYILYAIPSGLLLSTSYALRLHSNPFVCTALIHSIYNLIGFIFNNWN